MVIKNWQAQTNATSIYITTAILLLGGIVLFLFSASSPTIAFEVFPNLFWIFCGMILIVIFLFYQARDAYLYRDFQFMIVGVESEKAIKVIENALDSKNFPYTRSDTEFRLKTEGLMIKVKEPRINRHTNGEESSIWIGPISKSNFEITQNLKANIEDGFQLKGLV